MLCISICDKAGLLSEKCKRCVTNLSHLPSVGDCHEDEDDWPVLVASGQSDNYPSFLVLRICMYVECHENDDDVDDNVCSLTSTTTICNLDSVNCPRPHSSFISMLFNCHTFMHLLFRDKTACFLCTLYI